MSENARKNVNAVATSVTRSVVWTENIFATLSAERSCHAAYISVTKFAILDFALNVGEQVFEISPF